MVKGKGNFWEIIRKYKQILIWMFIAALFVTMLPVGLISVQADEKVIRVGYDENSTFIQESDGSYYGYGVEYLEKNCRVYGLEI